MPDPAAAPLLPSPSGDRARNSPESKDPSFNNNSNNNNNNNNKNTSSNSIDDVIERYMEPSPLLLPTLAAFAWFFDAQQAFITIFSDASPPWHCTTTTSSSSCTPCISSPSSWSYSLPRRISTVSDFTLLCSSPLLLALPSSSFFSGCLSGGLLLAALADSRLGRKKTLFFTTLSMSLSSALTALSPNIFIYSSLRFACGFARANIGTSAFVLSAELTSRRRRDQISILNFLFFTLGFLSLPAIAFFNKTSSWRSLYLFTSIPCLFYSILIHFWMKESPRWLLIKGRREEAVQTLKNLTFVVTEISDLTEMEITPSENGVFSSARILWERKWALRRLSAITAVSFGVGLVYYGMPLNLGNLTADLYLSTALNAAAELPSSLASFLIARRMRRRSAVVALTAVSGACSLGCAAVMMMRRGEGGGGGRWAEMALELGSFFAACTACNVMIMYGSELFPTCVRNLAVGVVRQVVVVGGAAAPVMVAEGRRRRVVSFGVFGVVILFGGLFAGFLPETKGCGIRDTMEEEEEIRETAARNAGA